MPEHVKTSPVKKAATEPSSDSFRFRNDHLDALGDKVFEVHRIKVEVHPARFDQREVEDILDQLVEVI